MVPVFQKRTLKSQFEKLGDGGKMDFFGALREICCSKLHISNPKL